MNKTTICFVCSGCTDRSPMAVWIANAKIKDNKLDCSVFARGLFVENDAKVSSKSVKAVEHLGIPARAKVQPTELQKEEIEKFDYIFCMTNEQKAIIKSKFGKPVRTIAEAADFVEIEDPCGQNQEAYDSVAKNLDYAIEQIFERLFKRRKI